jgi:redox-sensitive bicupin YhaK (pirin superfamily)
MKTLIHKSSDRGKGEHGWLSSRFSFSFADWYEPTRMGFGALRVLNDDTIQPASGFGMHPHKDMEIITIVMGGTVTHKDSMENTGTVPAGDVQVMSAGTGVTHSEYNESKTEPLKLFQLWIETQIPGVRPRYAQATFPRETAPGELTLLVAPLENDEALGIYQGAYICCGSADATHPISYKVRGKGNGVYIFVIDGELTAGGETLGARDAVGISEIETIELASPSRASFLLIEVPLLP